MDEDTSTTAGACSWYAVCTRSRHEKQVSRQLAQRGVEHFLPTYKARSRWKDRTVELQLPLFPGYLFVRIALMQRLEVLTTAGACRFVSFQGKPAPLDALEIERLRAGLSGSVKIEPYPYLRVGQRVRVRRGPLRGAEGVLVRKRGGDLRFVLSMDLIMQSAAVEVEAGDLETA